jgi:hypothetical protein
VADGTGQQKPVLPSAEFLYNDINGIFRFLEAGNAERNANASSIGLISHADAPARLIPPAGDGKRQQTPPHL